MWWAEVLYPSFLVCGMFGVILLVGIGFSYLWLVWLNKQATKCPECAKKGAGELVESNVIDSRIRTERRTRIGLFRQDESMVQVKEEMYEDQFECQYCGHRWTRTGRWTQTTLEKKRPSASPRF